MKAPTSSTRTCPNCRVTKPVACFEYDRLKCKDCRNEYYRQKRARLKKAHKAHISSFLGIDAASKKEKTDFTTSLPKSKVYVITWAQNATPIHEGFLSSIKVFCKQRKAELLIIPGTYHNQDSRFTLASETDKWWDDAIDPYLIQGRFFFTDELAVHADTNILPTTRRPVQRNNGHVFQHSAIVGHPAIQLITIPTDKRGNPRFLLTTGSITRPNYVNSNAGTKAEQHHVYGAVVVEIDGKDCHFRHINAEEDGSFTDLLHLYTPKGVKKAPRPLAVVCGDIHVDKSDEDVLKATFTNKDSLLRYLKPEKVIYHDVLDFDVRNHHTINDIRERVERAVGYKNDVVEDEVKRAINFIDDVTPPGIKPVVIQSNHDEAFDRWLNEANHRNDPVNARFWFETNAKIYRARDRMGRYPTALELMYSELGKGKAYFVKRDEPYNIKDIACGFHGDKGSNGARPGNNTYPSLGVKTIVGHRHTPQIIDGCYTVGVTGKLDMGYNLLPSSWFNTHCVVYASGKRTLIHIINGKWRGK